MKLLTLLTLAKIPLDVLVVILRYYLFGGLRFRKFNRSLINCIKLNVFRTALKVDIMDSKWLGPYSNAFLLRKLIPLINKPLVADLPGYGEQYDSNSIWLVKQPDRKPSDPVIIFCHGGGYFIQTMPLQIQTLLAVYRLLDEDKRRKTSILFLDYKLVSEGYPFPTQIQQLHATYSKLVAEGASNLILMGDSAGGHLSVGYTQYLRSVEKPVYPKKLLLISPWVKLSPLPADLVEGKSWIDNEHYDMIHHSKFAHVADLVKIVGREDPFSLVYSPGGKTPRSKDDWSDIATYSSPECDVFLILGEDESFRDDILEWAKYALHVPWFDEVKYGNLHEFLEKKHYELERRGVEGQANVSVYVEPLGVHDSMLFFENIGRKMLRNIKHGRATKVADLDDVTYFGVIRLTRFLNETL